MAVVRHFALNPVRLQGKALDQDHPKPAGWNTDVLESIINRGALAT